MLAQLIKDDFGIKEDYSCAEKILYGANKVYGLGLDKQALKLVSGFGGGMGIESVCGALTGSIMVLGRLFVVDKAHESPRCKELTKELLNRYQEEMGDILCKPLKEKYRTEEEKCKFVVLKAAELLDSIVAREQGKA